MTRSRFIGCHIFLQMSCAFGKWRSTLAYVQITCHAVQTVVNRRSMDRWQSTILFSQPSKPRGRGGVGPSFQARTRFLLSGPDIRMWPRTFNELPHCRRGLASKPNESMHVVWRIFILEKTATIKNAGPRNIFAVVIGLRLLKVLTTTDLPSL